MIKVKTDPFCRANYLVFFVEIELCTESLPNDPISKARLGPGAIFILRKGVLRLF